MLTPLLLVLWPASLVLTWLVAQGLANKPFDRALEYNVQALAQLVTVSGREVRFNLPQPASEILRADDADIIYYQVLGLRGEYIAGERDLPLPPEDERPVTGQVRLRNDNLRGLDLRVAYLWVRTDVTGAQPVLVQVSETLEKRSTLATEIVKGVMLPQFVTLPLAVLLVWIGLSYALRPLNELERRVRARRPDDLSPLDDKAVPQEVAPLVSSVNDLLTRLELSIQTQKRFLTDAAHQLKTPLAGLRMQADLALRQGSSEADLKQSLAQIARSSIRATHTVNQLLALARAEATGRAPDRQPVNLAAITREVVQDSVSRAMDKRIDIGYDGPDPLAFDGVLQGQPTLLKELVRNLLDNAINYTPEGGVVTARVVWDPFMGIMAVQVEDSGPGIAPAERALVFQPFYRALGTNVDGSGLGLAIVDEIARQHGATVRVDDTRPAHQPPGARFTVTFETTTRPSAGAPSDGAGDDHAAGR